MFRIVTSRARVSSGKYLAIGSSTLRFPSSCSSRMQAAVNCLLIDPIAYYMSAVASTGGSSLALPNAFV
jgi:hypothetical protein